MRQNKKLYYDVISLHVGIAKQSYDNLLLILKMSLYNYPIKESLSVIYDDFMPIETLSTDEKKDLWDEINKHFADKSKDDRIQLCKNMYILGNLF